MAQRTPRDLRGLMPAEISCLLGGENTSLPNGLYSLEGLEAVFLVVFLGSEFFQDFLLLF